MAGKKSTGALMGVTYQTQMLTPVVGGIIKATATDPGSQADIPSWARTTGNEVVKTEKDGKNFVFYVKRLK